MIFFPCQQCHQHVFLYRNLCAECAPDLHAAYEEACAIWDMRFARFKAETGVEPLSDWNRFEQWCEAQPAV